MAVVAGSGMQANEEERRMKRDMDLVRKILFAVEDNEDGNVNLDNIGYSRDRVYLHVELMKEHGLVDALVVPASDGPEHRILACRIRRLTWDGHEFLNEVRKDEVWEKAKKICLEKTGGLAFGALKTCLSGVITQLIES